MFVNRKVARAASMSLLAAAVLALLASGFRVSAGNQTRTPIGPAVDAATLGKWRTNAGIRFAELPPPAGVISVQQAVAEARATYAAG
jgi:hypothetical protein